MSVTESEKLPYQEFLQKAVGIIGTLPLIPLNDFTNGDEHFYIDLSPVSRLCNAVLATADRVTDAIKNHGVKKIYVGIENVPVNEPVRHVVLADNTVDLNMRAPLLLEAIDHILKNRHQGLVILHNPGFNTTIYLIEKAMTPDTQVEENSVQPLSHFTITPQRYIYISPKATVENLTCFMADAMSQHLKIDGKACVVLGHTTFSDQTLVKPVYSVTVSGTLNQLEEVVGSLVKRVRNDKDCFLVVTNMGGSPTGDTFLLLKRVEMPENTLANTMNQPAAPKRLVRLFANPEIVNSVIINAVLEAFTDMRNGGVDSITVDTTVNPHEGQELCKVHTLDRANLNGTDIERYVMWVWTQHFHRVIFSIDDGSGQYSVEAYRYNPTYTTGSNVVEQAPPTQTYPAKLDLVADQQLGFTALESQIKEAFPGIYLGQTQISCVAKSNDCPAGWMEETTHAIDTKELTIELILGEAKKIYMKQFDKLTVTHSGSWCMLRQWKYVAVTTAAEEKAEPVPEPAAATDTQPTPAEPAFKRRRADVLVKKMLMCTRVLYKDSEFITIRVLSAEHKETITLPNGLVVRLGNCFDTRVMALTGRHNTTDKPAANFETFIDANKLEPVQLYWVRSINNKERWQDIEGMKFSTEDLSQLLQQYSSLVSVALDGRVSYLA